MTMGNLSAANQSSVPNTGNRNRSQRGVEPVLPVIRPASTGTICARRVTAKRNGGGVCWELPKSERVESAAANGFDGIINPFSALDMPPPS
jgi:hypothetical protein